MDCVLVNKELNEDTTFFTNEILYVKEKTLGGNPRVKFNLLTRMMKMICPFKLRPLKNDSDLIRSHLFGIV